jgi:hypothetical protein
VANTWICTSYSPRHLSILFVVNDVKVQSDIPLGRLREEGQLTIFVERGAKLQSLPHVEKFSTSIGLPGKERSDHDLH